MKSRGICMGMGTCTAVVTTGRATGTSYDAWYISMWSSTSTSDVLYVCSSTYIGKAKGIGIGIVLVFCVCVCVCTPSHTHTLTLIIKLKKRGTSTGSSSA